MKKLFIIVFSVIAVLSVICMSASAEGLDQIIEVNGVYTDDNSSRSSGFLYSDSMLLNGSSTMSGDICKASVVLASAAYNEGSIAKMLDQMGYESHSYDYSTRTLEDNDRVAFTIGKKEQDGYVFYCIAIRGTHKNCEWFSNFNVGDPYTNKGNHAGFNLAAEKVCNTIDGYFASDGYNRENRILWFMGHSRGAAVANILAAHYTSVGRYAPQGNVFAYTFACPAVTKHAMDYGNIFNFNNSGDVVPIVPLNKWGYERHGIDYEYAFTGDLVFENRYYTEVGQQNASTFDTLSYEEIIRTLFPEEIDINKPQGHFGAMLLAYAMGGRYEVSFPEFLEYYAKEAFSDDYLYQRVIKTSDIYSLYRQLSGDAADTTEEEAFLREAIQLTKDFSEDEFKQWLLDNRKMIEKIAKTTGKTIAEYADLGPVLSTVLRLAPTAWDVGKIIGCILDICENSNGTGLQPIVDGHRPSTYVIHINAKYFGYRAYQDAEVVSVTIPDCVSMIGQACFQNSAVAEVQGMEHVISIGADAFHGCQCLSGELALPEGLTYIGKRSYLDCTMLTGLTIPSTITEIPLACFKGCTGLETVFIPTSVVEISDTDNYTDNGAFYGCTGIKSITLPVELSKDNHTFWRCSNVQSIHYTKGSTGIMPDREWGRNITLEHCSHSTLEEVYFDEGIVRIGNKAFSKVNEGISTDSSYRGTGVLKKVVLPSTLESIGQYAFSGQTLMEMDVNLPSGLLRLEERCFSCCESLTGELVLPEGLEYLGAASFYDCKNLTGTLKIPSTIKTIPRECFSLCEGIDTLIIPNTVEEISEGGNAQGGAFNCCYGLRSITLPVELSRPDLTFRCCFGVRSIHYTKGSTGIMPDRDWRTMSSSLEYAIYSTLEEVYFDEGIVHIGDYAFTRENEGTGPYSSGTGILKKAVLPSTIESIGKNAFAGQPLLEMDMKLPDHLTALGDYCFASCESLSGELVLPEGLSSLGIGCFYKCKNLTGTLKIPSTIETIPSECFSLCKGFDTLIIPNTVVELSNGGSNSTGGAFYTCTGLKSITLPIELSQSDTAFRYCTVQSIHYTKGSTGIMPDRSSNDWPLERHSASSLQEVSFDEGVNHIGSYAFYYNDRLNRSVFHGSVPSFGDNCFREAYQANMTYLFHKGEKTWLDFVRKHPEIKWECLEGEIVLCTETITLIASDDSFGNSAHILIDSPQDIDMANVSIVVADESVAVVQGNCLFARSPGITEAIVLDDVYWCRSICKY